ncbi:MAG TPA: RNA polymerase sigma factor RpoD/SigA [Verrucomicrobiales bacterium]|nr:RNA polymerase sigma factor RpoD/SigA [Verrucomicrobiales bacterium]
MKAHPESSASIPSLDTYLKEITAFPLLRRDEEQELARRSRSGDATARKRLIECNLRLVIQQAHKLKGMGVPLEDLIAEGNTGLMTAVSRFKPDFGAGLCTYAIWWIRQRMLRAIEEQGRTIRLPAHVLRSVRQMRAAVDHLSQVLGRDPEDWEVALHLGISEDAVKTTLSASKAVISLDDPMPGEESSLKETLAAETSDSIDPSDAACRNCDGQRLRLLLSKLPSRLRLILERRFGIACDHPHTFSEIGMELSLTRERIRQLERRAMSLIRRAAFRMDPKSNAHLLEEKSPAPSLRGVRKRRTSPKREVQTSRGNQPLQTPARQSTWKGLTPSFGGAVRVIALSEPLKCTG